MFFAIAIAISRSPKHKSKALNSNKIIQSKSKPTNYKSNKYKNQQTKIFINKSIITHIQHYIRNTSSSNNVEAVLRRYYLHLIWRYT